MRNMATRQRFHYHAIDRSTGYTPCRGGFAPRYLPGQHPICPLTAHQVFNSGQCCVTLKVDVCGCLLRSPVLDELSEMNTTRKGTVKNKPTVMARPRLRIKRYAVWMYLGAMAVFFFLKLLLRPWARDHSLPVSLEVVMLSLPNFLEAIIGLINVSAILMIGKLYLSPRFDNLSTTFVLLVALLLAGTFVLTQEFKLHNLGGNNVFDPNDVVASVLGLAATFVALLKYGVIEKELDGRS